MRRELWFYVGLAAATIGVYAQVGRYEFLQYDDRDYVTENRHVTAGWTLEGVVWAFTSGHASNWHPLTWLSHMTDCQLFGLKAGAHHWVNLLFHLANVMLLFTLLRWMTGAIWRSAFVAGVFALHPLHVESVAWIAERKDVLSTLFGFLTLLAYVRYVEKPTPSRYLLTLFCFALAVLSKPMMVTLPFVVLLLDFWPLGRLAPDRLAEVQRAPAKKCRKSGTRVRPTGYLLKEKIPFLILTAASSVITIIVQRAGGSVVPMETLSIGMRLSNALLSYVRYIGKIIWPSGLAIFYPYPSAFHFWQVAAAALLLLGITLAAIWYARSKPYLAVGWFWYVGMLVPVIGLVQVGIQSMADRYTYVPMIGILIIAAWGVPELVSTWRQGTAALSIMAPLLLAVYSIDSWNQLRSWRDTMTLFTHARDVTDNNFQALNGIGSVLADRGDYAGALPYYEKATRINPAFAQARSNLGIALFQLGRVEEAIKCYREALRLSPGYSDAYYNLGVALFSLGHTREAISAYENALRSNALNVKASYNLAIALATAGRTREAFDRYSETLKIEPDYAEAHNNLGILLFNNGRIADAIVQFSDAVRLKPDWAEARRNLSVAQAQQRQTPR